MYTPYHYLKNALRFYSTPSKQYFKSENEYCNEFYRSSSRARLGLSKTPLCNITKLPSCYPSNTNIKRYVRLKYKGIKKFTRAINPTAS